MQLGPDGSLPEALSRAGRYKALANGLRIKVVTANKGSVTSRCFVIVHNPEQESTGRARRDDIVRETERRLEELQQLEGKGHSHAACALRTHRTFGRYVKTSDQKRILDALRVKPPQRYPSVPTTDTWPKPSSGSRRSRLPTACNGRVHRAARPPSFHAESAAFVSRR